MFEFLSSAEWDAVRLSLLVAGLAALAGLPLGLVAALALERARGLLRLGLDGLIHLPLVLPPVVTGFLLLVLLGRGGVAGQALEDLFGVRLVFTTSGAVVATLVMTVPLIARHIRLALQAIDPGLAQVAASLGAGPLDRFVAITLPLMVPGILSGVMLAFIAGLGEFGAVITFAASIPGETRTLPLAIYGALQVPGGETAAGRMALVSIALGLLGLALANALTHWAWQRFHGREPA